MPAYLKALIVFAAIAVVSAIAFAIYQSEQTRDWARACRAQGGELVYLNSIGRVCAKIEILEVQ